MAKFTFPSIAVAILVALDTAEKTGKPMPREFAVKQWGDSESWEVLVKRKYIQLDDKVTVTAKGRKWMAQQITAHPD